jgi:hypothetical protein
VSAYSIVFIAISGYAVGGPVEAEPHAACNVKKWPQAKGPWPLLFEMTTHKAGSFKPDIHRKASPAMRIILILFEI